MGRPGPDAVAIIRPMLAPWLGVVLATCLVAQDPKQKTPPGKQPVEASAEKDKSADGKERVVDDKAAKAIVEGWNKVKGKGSFEAKLEALERIGSARHRTFVPMLKAVVVDDKSAVLQQRAAALLAEQAPAEALPVCKKLLGDPKVEDPAVLAELVRGVHAHGYDKSCWPMLEPLFERSFAQEFVPLQMALLDIVQREREKQAVPMLLRHLDEPAPADVNAGDNPPTEYWEARWKAWQAWRPRVQGALLAITGQRFDKAEDAKQWLKKNPLK